jgi:hypothetical protein
MFGFLKKLFGKRPDVPKGIQKKIDAGLPVPEGQANRPTNAALAEKITAKKGTPDAPTS